MRVLHVLDHSIPLHSGYSFRTRAILEQQRRRGWETLQLTGPKHNLESPAGDEETVDGFRFFRTQPPRAPWSRLPVVSQWAIVRALRGRLLEVARAQRPDILHAHSPVLNALAALSVGRALNIPVVYEVRAFWEDAAADHGTAREGGPRYRLTRALETYALKRAHAVTTICEGLRRDIIGRGVAPDKVTVIPNAVDVDRFSTDHVRDDQLAATLDLAGKRVLGFIGSFYAYEGLPLLLEALPRVRADAEVRLLLVGGGPDEARLKQRARELGISPRVVFVGRVPHEQVARYYSLVDVFVYPRYSMRLTELVTPLKPLEAMAQGRLVVASDVGGHRELIRDGETGVLFRAGDAASLASQVSELLARPQQWPVIRAAARRFVEVERNWSASVARYEQVYGRLVV